LNFEIFKIEKFHSLFQIRESETNIKLSDDLEIHFIEMPKFEKANLELDDKLNEWLLFLKDPNNKILEKVMEKEKNIKKAITILDIISQDKQERMLYEARQKAIMDYNSNMYGAREEGRTEGKFETAKAMINDGMDIALVSKYTGIDVQKLNSLKT
jgi:predicted transposase/invertase (TIGR01784 family)